MCACAENEIYPTKYPNMWRYMFEHTLFHVGVYVNVRFITSRISEKAFIYEVKRMNHRNSAH